MKRNLKKGVNLGKEAPTGGGNPPTPTFNNSKCERCKNWAFGCELDGNSRRDCKKNDYKHFELKDDIQLSYIITLS